MIIPSFHAGRVARAAAGGGGVTPNAVNWADINNPCSGYTEEKTIMGINIAINLVISWNVLAGTLGVFNVVINGYTFDLVNDYSSPTTFSISNNDIIQFYINSPYCTFSEIFVTVTNASDGNAVLDTFTMTTTGGEGGGGGG